MIENEWTKDMESMGLKPDWKEIAGAMIEEAAHCYRLAVRNELHGGPMVPDELKSMFARLLETAGCNQGEVRKAFNEIYTSEMAARE